MRVRIRRFVKSDAVAGIADQCLPAPTSASRHCSEPRSPPVFWTSATGSFLLLPALLALAVLPKQPALGSGSAPVSIVSRPAPTAPRLLRWIALRLVPEIARPSGQSSTASPPLPVQQYPYPEHSVSWAHLANCSKALPLDVRPFPADKLAGTMASADSCRLNLASRPGLPSFMA